MFLHMSDHSVITITTDDITWSLTWGMVDIELSHQLTHECLESDGLWRDVSIVIFWRGLSGSVWTGLRQHFICCCVQPWPVSPLPASTDNVVLACWALSADTHTWHGTRHKCNNTTTMQCQDTEKTFNQLHLAYYISNFFFLCCSCNNLYYEAMDYAMD